MPARDWTRKLKNISVGSTCEKSIGQFSQNKCWYEGLEIKMQPEKVLNSGIAKQCQSRKANVVLDQNFCSSQRTNPTRRKCRSRRRTYVHDPWNVEKNFFSFMTWKLHNTLCTWTDSSTSIRSARRELRIASARVATEDEIELEWEGAKIAGTSS